MHTIARCGASAALWAAVFAFGAAVSAEDVPGGVAAVPPHTIIVKGAWPSASDASTPLPEGGHLGEGSYQNDYFGLTLRFSARWQPGLEGPPPSDSGSYVLAQIVPAEGLKTARPGHLLITAQDTFFTPTAATSARDLIHFTADHLDRSVYRVEQPPVETRLAGRTFVRFAYVAPLANVHWVVLATEVRCHVVEFVLVGANPAKLADLQQALERMALAPAGNEVPLCIRDYAGPDTVIERAEPRLTESRFNSIPVRIIIDREGRVRHIHFLRAFPDQVQTITDALHHWRFKPYLVNGSPVEVETGLVFGRRGPPTAALRGGSH